MYEAPDRYKRMVSARLPDGESLAFSAKAETENSPLRDAQLLARAQLAPFFAAANVVAAAILVVCLWSEVSLVWLGGWAATVGLVNLLAMQMARTQAITHVGRSGQRLPDWMLVADIGVRAALWLSLPLDLFPSLSPGSQLITASITAGLGIASLGLVVVLPCVVTWMAMFTAGLSASLLSARRLVTLLSNTSRDQWTHRSGANAAQ